MCQLQFLNHIVKGRSRTMKKSLRILTGLSLVASSILFATPSFAVSVDGVDVTVGGGTTIDSSTSNRVILSGSSNSASDYVDIDLGGGNSFRIANMNENNDSYSPRPTIGIPSTPESGYSKTINVGLGARVSGTSGSLYKRVAHLPSSMSVR
jgi:hypothetical protein